MAFLGAGAYGAVMASDYNAQAAVAAEVLVDGGRFSVVKPRIEPAERFSLMNVCRIGSKCRR